MKSSLAHSIEIILVLTKEEADWLNLAMQNPVFGHSISQESPKDAEMRRIFREATNTTSTRGQRET